jgi:hypothetical protein
MNVHSAPQSLFILLSVLLSCTFSLADTLTLKDGQVITGKFISRNDQNVVFEIGGQQMKFSAANVAGIQMDMAPAPAVPATAAPVATPAPAQATQVTIPAGTRMMARTVEALNSKKHKEGHKFTARLETDIVVGGVTAAPQGSTLYGVLARSKSSGRLAGSSEMVMTFTDIRVNNQLHPIATTSLKAAGESTGKGTASKTARGALIGGLIGGSDDAKRGAKIGLGASLLTRGNQINIPGGTLIEFQLRTPLLL